MVYIETDIKDAAFHFSVEEYIMREHPFNQPVLMIWQTEKCVMLGNYQVAEAEIDMNLARKEEMEIVRRSSGGGTIFTDPDTFLVSIIRPNIVEENSQQTSKEEIANLVVQALSVMDIPAEIQGRNDITVQGKKIIGIAQHSKYGKICSHCSLLYDTDLDKLTKVLRVDDEKIRSKAIKSIRSRVTNIKEHMRNPCATAEFLERFKQALFSEIENQCGSKPQAGKLSESALEQINQICEEKYKNPAWTIGKSPKFSYHNHKRFPGGKIEVYLDIEKGIVKNCSIRGDFLGTEPIRDLEELLENNEFQYQEFCDVLAGISLKPFLGSITKDELLSCLTVGQEVAS